MFGNLHISSRPTILYRKDGYVLFLDTCSPRQVLGQIVQTSLQIERQSVPRATISSSIQRTL